MFLYIVCYDVWFYVSHIILHSKHFYKFHKIHHAVPYNSLKYNDTHKAHYIENIIQPIGIFTPFLFKHGNLYRLLIAFIFISIRGALRHDNRLIWLVGDHHILHHQHINYNYGEKWLDKIFGTLK